MQEFKVRTRMDRRKRIFMKMMLMIEAVKLN